MLATEIPVITVSYNTPELISNLLTTFRERYKNPYYIIDGSDPENLEKVKSIVAKFENVHLIDFGYNIHHGPGMAWAINNLSLSGPVLFLDSDIEIVRAGFIEDLLKSLMPEMYGVGAVNCINRDGFNIDGDSIDGIRCLIPMCMLCNIEVMRQWPLPIKHGMPMTAAMLALYDSNASHLIKNIDWVMNDIITGTEKIFIDHKGSGTVIKTGGYHLEEWMQEVQQGTAQTADKPTNLNNYNFDLLRFIPKKSHRLIEVGCNSGSLAAAYKKINPNCVYSGIEIDSASARSARNYCDSVLELDIESVGIEFFKKFSHADCWVFGDVLEHLKNPWLVLSHIRSIIPSDGSIVACIPNAQHWSIQARLALGDFRYEEGGGLLDKTHLRWFTRQTIFELFASAGFQVIEGCPRIFNEPMREKVIPVIQKMAEVLGVDPKIAVNDSLPLQYVIRAIPTEQKNQ